MFTKLTIKDKDYDLNLTTRNCVELEKLLGHNPIELILSVADDTIPTISDIALTLQYMLKGYNHGITISDTYDLIDEYTAEGHTVFELIPLMIEVFQNSGFISKVKKEDKSKN